MRNYIHVNLCISLFIAQLIFIVGVEPSGSEVSHIASACFHDPIVYLPLPTPSLPDCLSGCGSVASLFLPGDLHVDADGGSRPLCGTRKSLCQTPGEVHHRIHSCQLW